MRRIAVHFWPDFTVISRTTSFTSSANASESAVASGSNNAEFKLSASMLTRTERSATARCERILTAVSAEPVNESTSNGCKASSKPLELPQIIDKAPGGNTPAAMTSATMRCVSHAVAVAGFTITGTPESRAGAAFSHSPHDGKLKALMNSAMPRVGTITCCELKLLSLPNLARAPSSNALVSPSAVPHRAY